MLLQELENVMRRASAHGTMFAQAVASRAGISSSDMDCLDFLNLEGRMTAGRLAELTGLTTGAITGVVDRLEKAGFVRRERDESDRRKVFVAPVPGRMAEIERLYRFMKQAMQKQAARYTDDELKLLVRYATDSSQSILEATTQLKALMEDAPEKAARTTKPRRGP